MDITDWIQAFGSLATFFLAAIIFIQDGKIKTLTDVVDELSKQSKIMAQRYQLESDLSLKDRMPVLILPSRVVEFTEKTDDKKKKMRCRFVVRNDGRTAHHVRFYTLTPEVVTMISSELAFRTVLENHDEISIEFITEYPDKVVFAIEYEDDRGTPFRQKVVAFEGRRLKMGGPESLMWEKRIEKMKSQLQKRKPKS